LFGVIIIIILVILNSAVQLSLSTLVSQLRLIYPSTAMSLWIMFFWTTDSFSHRICHFFENLDGSSCFLSVPAGFFQCWVSQR
jgi:hypothetical protein